jgi:pilus assembly protein CpaB
MRRRIIILLAAAVLAVVSAAMVVAYAQGSDRRALAGRKGTWVLLATGVIPADTTGAEIRAKRLVRQVLMPVDTVPSGALGKLDPAMNDMKVNAAIQPDQMLMSRQFEPAPPPTPSAAPTFALPADRVAVSVELGIAPQVAGNVDPGDKVTVYLTYPKEDTVSRPQKTGVLLAKATVISVGESPLPTASPTPAVSARPSAGAAAPTVIPSASPTGGAVLERYVVTLAVTPEQGKLLINGYNTGHLHLGLLGAKATASATAAVAVTMTEAS